MRAEKCPAAQGLRTAVARRAVIECGAQPAQAGWAPLKGGVLEHDAQAPRSEHLGSPPASVPSAAVLAARLRTLTYERKSALPPLTEVMLAARDELPHAKTLGVLFVRINVVGRAGRELSPEQWSLTYETLADTSRSLLGLRLRRVDMPADLGMAGRGFAIILSQPREKAALDHDDVQRVADRYGAEIRSFLEASLPAFLARRLLVHVGGSVIRSPEGAATVEEMVIQGIASAYAEAVDQERNQVLKLGRSYTAALESGSVLVRYRPVYRVGTARIAGYEVGLALPDNPDEPVEDVVFDVVRRCGESSSAYTAYHKHALREIPDSVGSTQWLLLWSSAGDLVAGAVKQMAYLFGSRYGKGLGLSPGNVVFALDMEDIIAEVPASLISLRSAADMGYRLAFDIALGSPLPLEYVRFLSPDLIRLGGRYVLAAEKDQDVLDLLSVIVRFAQRSGCQVLFSDVRTRSGLERARSLGADLIEGVILQSS